MSLGKNLYRGTVIAAMGALGASVGGIGIAVAGTAIGISGILWGSTAGGLLVTIDKVLDIALENIELKNKKKRWW